MLPWCSPANHDGLSSRPLEGLTGKAVDPGSNPGGSIFLFLIPDGGSDVRFQ